MLGKTLHCTAAFQIHLSLLPCFLIKSSSKPVAEGIKVTAQMRQSHFKQTRYAAVSLSATHLHIDIRVKWKQ